MGKWVPSMIILAVTAVSCPTPQAYAGYKTTCLTCSLPGDTVRRWNPKINDRDEVVWTEWTDKAFISHYNGKEIIQVTDTEELRWCHYPRLNNRGEIFCSCSITGIDPHDDDFDVYHFDGQDLIQISDSPYRDIVWDESDAGIAWVQ